MKLPSVPWIPICLMVVGMSAAAQDQPSLTIPIGEADQHLIQRNPPIYPAIAKAARVEGVVQLKLLVGADGSVIQVLEPSGHPFLVRAATEAAKQYRYRPFEVAGAPADVVVQATVSFSLAPPLSPPVPFPDITDVASVLIEYEDGRISLRVGGDGLVEYAGASRVVIEGKHRHHIESNDVQQLIQAFRRADFFSLRDDYSVGATDVGQTRTSIRIGASLKSITDDWVQVPPALKAVQDAVLKYSHSDQWVTGNADTVPAIIAEMSNPSTRREILSDVLPRAALYSDTETVRAILAQGVDPEQHRVWDGTALMHAAQRGLPDMAAALLAAHANPRSRDKDGRTALIFGAGSGNARVVELLIATGASASEQDRYGDTTLMAAAASGNPDAVRLLLHHGARVNASNIRRQTALLSAASGDAGFAVSDEGRRRAEIPDDLVHRNTVVRMLLQAGADINARGWDGETALFSLEDDAVQELLRHHINLEARDKDDETALMETVSNSIAELLINAGADVNAENKKGQTALTMAAERNYVSKLVVLVKAPAIQLEHRDHNGATALMLARKAGHQDCVRTLIAAGATF